MKTDIPEDTQQARRGDRICATGATGGGIDSYQLREEDLQVTTWGTGKAERLDPRMNMRRKRQMMETGAAGQCPAQMEESREQHPWTSAAQTAQETIPTTHGKPKGATKATPVYLQLSLFEMICFGCFLSRASPPEPSQTLTSPVLSCVIHSAL
jgi:hypothetical protein